MMYGIVNDITGELERVITQEDYDDGFTDMDVGVPDKYFIELLDGFPEAGEAWDQATRSIVNDWAVLDVYFHELIDERAGKFRKKFITVVPGQEMTYLQKRTEAEAYDPSELSPQTAYPMIYAEATATGVPLADHVATVLNKANEWAVLGAAIEGMRMAAKAAVVTATDKEAKIAAANPDWQSLL